MRAGQYRVAVGQTASEFWKYLASCHVDIDVILKDVRDFLTEACQDVSQWNRK